MSTEVLELRPPDASEPSPGSDVEFRDPSLFVNRELSLLEFMRRVLAQARDPDTPLLEQLRFLTICSTILDEFFEIRVSGLKQQVELGVDRPGPDGMGARETLSRISETVHELVDLQYRVLNEELFPTLEAEGIRMLKRSDWSEGERTWIRAYFDDQVLPVLTPVGLDPSHPFPRILNKSLTFVVTLDGDDAFGRTADIAVVQVPRCLPRTVLLPAEVSGGRHDFVMLSSVIHSQIDRLFPGMIITGCFQFRVTRNSDLWVDEEETDDLLSALEGELPARNYGQAVRLEVADSCSREAAEFLLAKFNLGAEDLYQVNGPVNLHRLGALCDRVDRPELKFPNYIPAVPPNLGTKADLFAAIRQGDILLHHPYQSFQPVVEFIRQAAADPDVLAIKQTLYRTGLDSPFVQALIEAAQAGKAVTAVVELRARFDEAANIRWATRLQEVGANVVYGVVGYKTHAKMLLVVRREGDRLRRYVHLGTGNYHTRTARLYSDFGFLSCRDDFGNDVHDLFVQLTGLGEAPVLERLTQAPFSLHSTLMSHIEGEIAEAELGRPAFIKARMNQLTERKLIIALYRASRAGVKVDLVVRGVCRLRPGMPGVSENIRVRSIVGRFLEHPRVFWFHAGGADPIYLSSADWMDRNMFRRVETCWPVEDPALKQRLKDEGISVYMADNSQAWQLHSDGHYMRHRSSRGQHRSAQRILMQRLGG